MNGLLSACRRMREEHPSVLALEDDHRDDPGLHALPDPTRLGLAAAYKTAR